MRACGGKLPTLINKIQRQLRVIRDAFRANVYDPALISTALSFSNVTAIALPPFE